MHLYTHERQADECEPHLTTFDAEINLSNHLPMHRREKPYECSVCSKKFFTDSKLSGHLLTHANEKSDECQICFQKFSEKSCLLVHILQTHTSEKSHECATCGAKFVVKKNFLEHLLAHKMEIYESGVGLKKIYKKENSNSVPRKKRKKWHGGTFRCKICPIRFRTENRLLTHLATHKEVKYKCKICCKEFPKKNDLSVHFLSHVAEDLPELCSINVNREIKPVTDLSCRENSKETGVCNKKNILKNYHSGDLYTSAGRSHLEPHQKIFTSNGNGSPSKHELCSQNFTVENHDSSTSFTQEPIEMFSGNLCYRNQNSSYLAFCEKELHNNEMHFKNCDWETQNLDELTPSGDKLEESKISSNKPVESSNNSSSFFTDLNEKSLNMCSEKLLTDRCDSSKECKMCLAKSTTNCLSGIETCSKKLIVEHNNSNCSLGESGKLHAKTFVPKSPLATDNPVEMCTKNALVEIQCLASSVVSLEEQNVQSKTVAILSEPYQAGENAHTFSEKSSIENWHFASSLSDLTKYVAESPEKNAEIYSDLQLTDSDEESSKCEISSAGISSKNLSCDLSSHSGERPVKRCSKKFSSEMTALNRDNFIPYLISSEGSDSLHGCSDMDIQEQCTSSKNGVQVAKGPADANSSYSESNCSDFWFNDSDEESQDYKKCDEKLEKKLPASSVISDSDLRICSKEISSISPGGSNEDLQEQYTSRKSSEEKDSSSTNCETLCSESDYSDEEPRDYEKCLSVGNVLSDSGERPVKTISQKVPMEIDHSGLTLSCSDEECKETISVRCHPTSSLVHNKFEKLARECSKKLPAEVDHSNCMNNDSHETSEKTFSERLLARNRPSSCSVPYEVEKPIREHYEKLLKLSVDVDRLRCMLSDSDEETSSVRNHPSGSSVPHEVGKPFGECAKQLPTEVDHSNCMLSDSDKESEETLSERLPARNHPCSSSDPHEAEMSVKECPKNLPAEVEHLDCMLGISDEGSEKTFPGRFPTKKHLSSTSFPREVEKPIIGYNEKLPVEVDSLRCRLSDSDEESEETLSERNHPSACLVSHEVEKPVKECPKKLSAEVDSFRCRLSDSDEETLSGRFLLRIHPSSSLVSYEIEKTIGECSKKLPAEVDCTNSMLSDTDEKSEKTPSRRAHTSSNLDEVKKPIRVCSENLSAEIGQSNNLCNLNEETSDCSVPCKIAKPINGTCLKNVIERSGHSLSDLSEESQEACADRFAKKDNPSSNMLMDTSRTPLSDAENVPYFAERETHKCKMCSKTFRTKKLLLSHLVMHSVDKLYECKVCHKKFFTENDLSDHFLDHASDQLQDANHKNSTSRNISGNLITANKLQEVNSASKAHHSSTSVIAHKFKMSSNNFGTKNISLSNELHKSKVQSNNLDKNKSAKGGLCFNDFDPKVYSPYIGIGPYKCEICSKEFAKKQYLARHLNTHTDDKRFECTVCHKKFLRKFQLSEHMPIHKGKKTHECDICGKKYTAKSNLSRHKRTHLGDKPHKCNWCPKTFANKSDLSRHVHSHEGVKKYECKMCEKQFLQADSLAIHVRTHSFEKPYTCEVCSLSCSTSSNLSKHMLMHANERPRASELCLQTVEQKERLVTHVHTHGDKADCEMCPRKFANKHDLSWHLLTHTGEQPHKCEVCSKNFSHIGSLRSHMLTHKDEVEKKHQCEVCSVKFGSKTALSKHVVTHNNKLHQCEICSKQFAQKCSLSRHLLTHVSEKPFECGVCLEKFRLIGDLSNHMLTHTNLQLFKCDECPAKFRIQSHLTKHLLTHSGKKAHVCEICSQKFVKRSDLLKHLPTHLGEKGHTCEICSQKFTERSDLLAHMPTHIGKKAN